MRRITPALALVALAGSTLRADDDDKKLLNKQPAVIHAQTHSNTPDAWKLRDRLGPIGGQTDDTFQSRNIILKSWLPLNTFPGFPGSSASGADCWGYTSPSGREYALMGLSWGNGIVEVTDPLNPHILTTIPGSVNSLWRDITVIGHYAYAVSDQSGVGIQVLDLADIDNGNVTLIRNYSQGGHTTTHTILSNPDSGYLYLCGGNAGGGGTCVPAATTPDPTFPTFTGGGWHNPLSGTPSWNYVHEAQIVNYTTGPYAGHEIAFLFAAGPYYGSQYTRALAIADVTNKSSIQTLSQIAYPGMQFCHQGWVSSDRKYLYVDDELDGPSAGNVPSFLTRVFDISDLSTPRMISVFNNGLLSIDHNQYTKGRYLFQSNYTSGLHVWDLSNPLKPVEVAWIDTRPEDGAGTGNPDAATYNGAWGNYPFFNSGTVLISDLERGLFIVRLSILELSLPAPAPRTVLPGQATPVSIQVNEKEATTGAVSLMVSINGGSYAPTPMTAQGGGLYTASLPAQNAFDRIRYYFQAQTTDAAPRTFTWPLNAANGDVLTAYVQAAQATVFSDNFESDTGWTVQTDAGVTSGAWVRATPLYNGGPGAVVGDADGSGKCFVTGNTLNAGLAGGATRLISPPFDLSAAPEARITYSRWLCSIVGLVDTLRTEISNDNGANWTLVHLVNPATGGWETLTFRIADSIAPTAQTRIRFVIANMDSSVTKAGIDAFSITNPLACYANCDGSATAPILNVLDFSCFLNRFAMGDPYANCDNSTTAPILNALDFACFLNAFAAGCS